MPKKPTNIVEPINATFDDVVTNVVSRSSQEPQKNQHSMINNRQNSQSLVQQELPLFHSDIHQEKDGIEMGVLENGVPYLSERGLIKMTGVARTTFRRVSGNESPTPATNETRQHITELLKKSGYTEDNLFIKTEFSGRVIYAYPEEVCLAILEYYAFDAPRKLTKAVQSFRVLSRAGFRLFIYQSVGYAPQKAHLDSWRHYHDRVDMLLDKVPSGYFCVFREISGMIVTLIRKGVLISDKVIPDISVGLTWAKKWKDNNWSEQYGDRINYEHSYPDYYPQSVSNPQDAKAYPNEVLAEFRKWFEHEYIESKFPKYLLNSAKKGNIQLEYATQAIEAFNQNRLENKKK